MAAPVKGKNPFPPKKGAAKADPKDVKGAKGGKPVKGKNPFPPKKK